MGAIIGYSCLLQCKSDLQIHSVLNIYKCTLSRYEAGFKECATGCIFPRALNCNICVCSLVQCSSEMIERLLGVVWQGLARSHFSAQTSLHQRYLYVHGFKCKLSRENNVLVLNPKLSPLAQGVPRPRVMADWGFILKKNIAIYYFSAFTKIFPRHPLLAIYQRWNTAPDGSWPGLCGQFYVLRPVQYWLFVTVCMISSSMGSSCHWSPGGSNRYRRKISQNKSLIFLAKLKGGLQFVRFMIR